MIVKRQPRAWDWEESDRVLFESGGLTPPEIDKLTIPEIYALLPKEKSKGSKAFHSKPAWMTHNAPVLERMESFKKEYNW